MNLNQVTVPSRDVARSIAFYQKLGLRLIVHSHAGYARFECMKGEATFSVHLVPEIVNSDGIVVYFELEELDARVKTLEKEGIVFDQQPLDQTWLWREAHLRDPDGNRLILYTAGENRKNPPWRLAEEITHSK